MDKMEAARNIRYALEGVGVDSDIALHQGFELVASFTNEPFVDGYPLHDACVAAAAAENERTE